ncbi:MULTISPECIES: aminopeptidase P family protein [unclassified Pedobacter]|uniref:aminopeptidase P family protein n=1 Tax=unclassified Pedobacter TaxID=2628915 RepID=UPI0014234645|nr:MULTISPECIES: aminopeptidase P family protein [unclassified Pedobacter]NII82198.1 Xaa-Pro aminopeptidase [Pedobacter sp. SG908]NMN36223.1 Xaa-Pro aminopeptidase [Pedobacter sp. SG918]
MTFVEKLQALRQLMAAQKIDAYVITAADPHISEYLPAHYKAIPFACGFTGSAGTLVITQGFAGLWTDSRYFTQAETQLSGSGYELVKLKVPHTPEYIDWLLQALPKGAKVGFNHQLITVGLALEMQNSLIQREIAIIDVDFISTIWLDRVGLPKENAFLISEEAAGLTISAKIKEVRAALKINGADYHFISSLDDIAWLFNLRGNDVDYNPVVLSFALITPVEVKLFMDKQKLTQTDIETLNQQGVTLRPYAEVAEALKNLPKATQIFIDPKRTCFGLYECLPSGSKIISGINPSTHLKSLKNSTEINHIRRAMLNDGVALTRFFKWMEDHFGKEKITEWSAAEKLAAFRAEQTSFVGLSFNTIAGYNANGALPHYSITAESNQEILGDGLFLVDSGGQYLYGTTDITRVMPIGNSSSTQADDYTLVLKGLIEGSKLIFPEGTKGYQIDSICRKPLWEQAINFGHGTGHGIGFFLNVHEGPQNISPANVDVVFKPGMVTSIEPGIYRPGKHGVRIENLVLCIPKGSSEFGDFLTFETLTLCFIDTAIINKTLLAADQIAWLNQYNQQVFDQLEPHLSIAEARWLKEKCRSI